MSTTVEAPPRTGARVRVQKLGTALSNMVMPNIGAFIAWGLITALFIEAGWLQAIFAGLKDPGGWVAQIGGWGDYDGAGIVGPMITYLLPLLIGYTGGRMVHGNRGAVVGAIATMGVITGAEVPMFMGAMIMGPLGGWCMKKLDALWEGKIRPGFEMLVDNFSAGILGMLLAIFGFFGIGPIVSGFTTAAGNAVDFLVENNLLPLTSILIEPAKVLFLNNAINHGVLTPLGTTQALETGKSVLFLLEANPGPGLGLLLAFMFFGKGAARASAPGAAIIQFFGGIHEIYFPYALSKPMTVLALIAGGATGVTTNMILGGGLAFPAAPGSIIAVTAAALSPAAGGIGNLLIVYLSVLLAATVTFLIAGVILRASRKRDLAAEADTFGAAIAQTEANKGKSSAAMDALRASTAGAASAAAPVATDRRISRIVFACDAGMGSSAMGASVLRNKIKKAGVEGIEVTNRAIANLDGTEDLIITQQQLTDRAKARNGDAIHVSVDNFMNAPQYDEVVEMVRRQSDGDA